MTITTDEWLSELQRLSRPTDPGLTAQEIADALEMSDSAVTRMLRKEVNAGRIIKGRRAIRDSFERWVVVPVYRPKEGAWKAKSKILSMATARKRTMAS